MVQPKFLEDVSELSVIFTEPQTDSLFLLVIVAFKFIHKLIDPMSGILGIFSQADCVLLRADTK